MGSSEGVNTGPVYSLAWNELASQTPPRRSSEHSKTTRIVDSVQALNAVFHSTFRGLGASFDSGLWGDCSSEIGEECRDVEEIDDAVAVVVGGQSTGFESARKLDDIAEVDLSGCVVVCGVGGRDDVDDRIDRWVGHGGE